LQSSENSNVLLAWLLGRLGNLGLCLKGLGGGILLEGVNCAKDSFYIGLALLVELEGYLGPLEKGEDNWG